MIRFNEDNNSCDIQFLDCRGYYDLAAQICGLIATIILLYRAISNYRQLKCQKGNDNDTQYEHSLRRKIRVNLLNILFLTIFLLHLLFSMIIFQISNEETVQQITNNGLQTWYKFSEILFIQLLNCLLLSVGWLYWKGLNFFYNIKQLTVPLVYSNKFILFFGACMIYFLVVLVTSGALIFATQDSLFLINLIVLISSTIAMAIFLAFRLLYYKNIFRSVKLGKQVVRRERIYNVLMVIAVASRVSLCTMGMFGIDFDQIRNYSNQCHDLSPKHGLVLFSITFIVDLLPSFIFTKIFTTFERQRGRKSDIQRTLFSCQPSELDISSGYQYK